MTRVDHSLFAGIGGHHSAKAQTEEWLTPPSIIAALGGADSFDLDPCAPAVQPWPTARTVYTRADNGLLRPWRGRVWLNPPYSTVALAKWLSRLAGHGVGTALIFARTETDAFFRHVWESASALLFIRGRLNFHYPDGRRAEANSGAPSVLCAYGRRDADVLALCGIEGQFVPIALPRAVFLKMLSPSWAELVREWFKAQSGTVRLDDAYRAFRSHPKARGNNHVEAKIRQTLQRGPYERVGRGLWRAG